MSDWFCALTGNGKEEHWINLDRVDYITITPNRVDGFDVTFWIYGSESPAELLYDIKQEELSRLRSILRRTER